MNKVTDEIPVIEVKEWLGSELHRNKHNAVLYVALVKRALHQLTGQEVQVLIGHHITFELDGRIETENEIPSADCLMFDHTIMGALFGEQAIGIMVELVKVPCDQRDLLLERYAATLGAIA